MLNYEIFDRYDELIASTCFVEDAIIIAHTSGEGADIRLKKANNLRVYSVPTDCLIEEVYVIADFIINIKENLN